MCQVSISISPRFCSYLLHVPVYSIQEIEIARLTNENSQLVALHRSLSHLNSLESQILLASFHCTCVHKTIANVRSSQNKTILAYRMHCALHRYASCFNVFFSLSLSSLPFPFNLFQYIAISNQISTIDVKQQTNVNVCTRVQVNRSKTMKTPN